MSVPFLMELRLAQLRLPEQYSLLVLPVLAAQCRRLLGLQLQVHPCCRCVVVMRQGDTHTFIAFYIMSFIN